MRKVLLIIGLLLAASRASATNHFVTPTGGGSGTTGVDWSHAYAGLPGILTRGDSYYLAAGTYSAITLSDVDSGTLVITISACTSSMTVCTGAAGWVAGDAVSCTSATQVVIPHLTFSSDYYTLNGQCRATDMTGEGIKINNLWPNSVAFPLNGSTYGNITVKYVEVQGAGLNLNSGETTAITSVSCSANVVSVVSGGTSTTWHVPYVGQAINVAGVTGGSGFNTGAAPAYVTIASVTDASHFTYNATCSGSGTGGTITGPMVQQEEMVRFINSTSNIYVGYSYFHDSSSQIFLESGVTGYTTEYNFIARNSMNAAIHGECWGSQSADTNVTVRYNVFQDCEGSASMIFVEAAAGATTTNLEVYGNVSVISSGNPYNRDNTGWGFLVTQQGINGAFIYDNSIINTNNPSSAVNLFAWQLVLVNTCININVENNLVYSSGSVTYGNVSGCSSVTFDYNSFLNNAATPTSPGTHDVVVASAAPNPFTAWTTGNYTLASENADWNNRVTLGSPYNIDAAGNTFTTDRGAYQYGGSPPATVPAPAQGMLLSMFRPSVIPQGIGAAPHLDNEAP